MPDFNTIKLLCREIPENSRLFPSEVFKLLHRMGFLQVGLPEEYITKDLNISPVEALFEIGKANLSVARIYEGHLNALKLIMDHGTSNQKNYYFGQAVKGKLFSVWNTERNFEEVKAFQEGESVRLEGAKTFCSGALDIDFALVTAATDNGKQLLVIPLKEYSNLEEDWSLWQPMGMKNSVSCRIDFTGIEVPEVQHLGTLNIYEEEPWFSGGAMRFAAVQLGGAQAVMDAVLEHLKQLRRHDDSYQQHRVGAMAIQMQTGKLWLAKAQKIYDNPSQLDSREIVNFANMMRTVVLQISESILDLAERSVGVQGFMKEHPMERVYRDLKVYLKQPGPDRVLQQVGVFTFEDSES